MRTQGSDSDEIALNLRRAMLAERPMRSAAWTKSSGVIPLGGIGRPADKAVGDFGTP
jgi:hypothetical protein